MNDNANPFAGAEIVAAYTRKQALEDGEQIDVSVTAAEAGIQFPVFLTRAIWEKYVRVPEGVLCQDERGRCWDILWLLRYAARKTSGPHMLFSLLVQDRWFRVRSGSRHPVIANTRSPTEPRCLPIIQCTDAPSRSGSLGRKTPVPVDLTRVVTQTQEDDRISLARFYTELCTRVNASVRGMSLSKAPHYHPYM